MSALMTQDESVMLCPADFPDYYVDMHHPDDYKLSNTYIDPEMIYHEMPDHNRCILRISIKIRNNIFTPVSFICDTGAPSYIYINTLTRRLIKEKILRDDAGTEFIYVNNRKMLVKPSPPAHPDTNIIGMMALNIFEFWIRGGTFGFDNPPKYL